MVAARLSLIVALAVGALFNPVDVEAQQTEIARVGYLEQPTKFDLVINLRTAELLDLRIPESVLVRADRTIR